MTEALKNTAIQQKKKGRKGNGVKSVYLGKFSRSITKISSLYVN